MKDHPKLKRKITICKDINDLFSKLGLLIYLVHPVKRCLELPDVFLFTTLVINDMDYLCSLRNSQ